MPSKPGVVSWLDENSDRRWARVAPDAGYQVFLTSLRVGAERAAGVFQNGSLPIYLGVILLTAVALPSVALLTTSGLGIETSPVGSGLQVALCLGVIAAAIGATRARKRFVAVLALGSVGFGIGALFIVQGGPDLALTQFLVETVAIVGFMLVLRHLPERFAPSHLTIAKSLRVVIAATVGVFVTLFALVAFTARTEEPVSRFFIDNSLPEAGGKNIVNVILVDFRALDTLGEISVLAIAALGIASLVRAVRRGRRQPPDQSTPPIGDLTSGVESLGKREALR